MPRAKRRKPYDPAGAHDRCAQDLPFNAEVATVDVDDPLALEPGEKIVAFRSIRNDPLGRLHAHRQIDDTQYRSGRAFQNDWQKAERGGYDARIRRSRPATQADHRGAAPDDAAPQSRRA
ncbi:hypothetical protein ACVIM9_003558 [Bradyrhizobium sp. USDA 4520]